MRKVLLRGPQGERWISEDQPFRFLPGEKIALDNGKSVITPDDDEAMLMQETAESGIQWGDAVAKMTKLFGIQPCSRCEKRRRILNEAKKLGIRETLAKLKETI